MKKLMTLAAAAIIFTGFETAALNAAETETAAETEIQQQDLKELKEGLKDGSKNGLAQGYKKGLAQDRSLAPTFFGHIAVIGIHYV